MKRAAAIIVAPPEDGGGAPKREAAEASDSLVGVASLVGVVAGEVAGVALGVTARVFLACSGTSPTLGESGGNGAGMLRGGGGKGENDLRGEVRVEGGAGIEEGGGGGKSAEEEDGAAPKRSAADMWLLSFKREIRRETVEV